jgi:hypothetical protein
MEGIPTHGPNSSGLLAAWGRGETPVFDRLVPLVRGELRRDLSPSHRSRTTRPHGARQPEARGARA